MWETVDPLALECQLFENFTVDIDTKFLYFWCKEKVKHKIITVGMIF